LRTIRHCQIAASRSPWRTSEIIEVHRQGAAARLHLEPIGCTSMHRLDPVSHGITTTYDLSTFGPTVALVVGAERDRHRPKSTGAGP
jgi:hypothetical protein